MRHERLRVSVERTDRGGHTTLSSRPRAFTKRSTTLRSWPARARSFRWVLVGWGRRGERARRRRRWRAASLWRGGAHEGSELAARELLAHPGGGARSAGARPTSLSSSVEGHLAGPDPAAANSTFGRQAAQDPVLLADPEVEIAPARRCSRPARRAAGERGAAAACGERQRSASAAPVSSEAEMCCGLDAVDRLGALVLDVPDPLGRVEGKPGSGPGVGAPGGGRPRPPGTR